MKRTQVKKIVIKVKQGSFLCRFESNFPDKGYTVTVPNLKGIVTFGENLAEAKQMIKEAIEVYFHEPDSLSKMSKKRDHLLKQWV